MEGCPPHAFSDGGAVIFCTHCGTQFRKITEDSSSEMDSIDELLLTLDKNVQEGAQEGAQEAGEGENETSEERQKGIHTKTCLTLAEVKGAQLRLSFSIVGHEVKASVVFYYLRVMNDGVPVCTCTIRFNNLKSFHDKFKVGFSTAWPDLVSLGKSMRFLLKKSSLLCLARPTKILSKLVPKN